MIGVVATAQVWFVALTAAVPRRRVTHPAQLGSLFLPFPALFIMADPGVRGPVVIALHRDPLPAPLVVTGTLLAMTFAASATRLAVELAATVVAAPQSMSTRGTTPAAGLPGSVSA